MLRNNFEISQQAYFEARDRGEYTRALNIVLYNPYLFSKKLIEEAGTNFFDKYIKTDPYLAYTIAKIFGLPEEMIDKAYKQFELGRKYQRAMEILSDGKPHPRKLIERAEKIVEYVESEGLVECAC